MPVGTASLPRGRNSQAARTSLSGRQFPADFGPFAHSFVPIRASNDFVVAAPPDQGRRGWAIMRADCHHDPQSCFASPSQSLPSLAARPVVLCPLPSWL